MVHIEIGFGCGRIGIGIYIKDLGREVRIYEEIDCCGSGISPRIPDFKGCRMVSGGKFRKLIEDCPAGDPSESGV